MATSASIVLFLVCAYLLQDVHTQTTDLQNNEESSSSSEITSNSEGFKEEIKLVEDKANAVMVSTCDFMKSLNLECAVGPMDGTLKRKFLGKFALNFAEHIYDYKVRILYTIVHLCQKLLNCINMGFMHIARGFISGLPPCTQQRFRTLQNWFKLTLERITRVLKLVYGYGREVARCGLSLGQCISTVFQRVFQTSMRIIQSIVGKVTQTVETVSRLSTTCPVPEQGPDPETLALKLGKCFFCAFKPNADECM